MKELDFRPHKSKSDFRKNYKLHDLAEQHGKNLLTQWGVRFKSFGEDRRYQKLWEKGKDKPDQIITINNKQILLDWKSKHKPYWILNKRAYDSYLKWGRQLSQKIIIAFFVFDDDNMLRERRFALIGYHNCKTSEKKQWDKNETVEFKDDLPEFNKANLLNLLAE